MCGSTACDDHLGRWIGMEHWVCADDRLLSHQRKALATATATAAAAVLTLTLIAFDSSALSLGSSSGLPSDDLSEGLCDLSRCWELYTSAQESLQLQDEYPAARLRSVLGGVDDVAVRCVAFRTFFLCLRNMSSGCLGDLSFHSAHKGVEKHMRGHNCSVWGRVYEGVGGGGGGDAGPSAGRSSSSSLPPPVCSFGRNSEGSSYEHCGVFGDGHLRTFNGSFETCDLQGAWALIDNEYLTVQVTSDRVGLGTAVKKVTVLLKRNDDCAVGRYVTYQATSAEFPATFDDGQTAFGRSDSVSIQDGRSTGHVRMYIRYIDTTVVIRLHAGYFAVSLKMPSEIVNYTVKQNANPLQLCVHRCPSRQRIDIRKVILFEDERRSRTTSAPEMTVGDALSECRAEHLLVDYYLDSCVFDLMTTGDSNLKSLSLHAYLDAVMLLPAIASKFNNRTTLCFSLGQRTVVVDYLLFPLLPLIIALVRG